MKTPFRSAAGKSRAQLAAAVALIVLALAAVAATHRVFSQTIDEPVHIASGYNALTRRDFLLDVQHPPLARMLFAVPLRHITPPAATDPLTRGNALLGRGRDYVRRLAAARRGNLLLLAVGLFAVAGWARYELGPAGGLMALLLYATTPPVLANAGLATTDMAAAATVPLALYALTLWLDRPAWWRALFLGGAIGVGMATKYSFPVFFLAGGVVIAALRARQRMPVQQVIAMIGVAALVVWAAFGFSVGTIDQNAGRDLFRRVAPAQLNWLAERAPLPAPSVAVGALRLMDLNRTGHPSMLFGEERARGWCYYFPVLLFFKTPIPLLLLFAVGTACGAWRYATVALALLIIALPTSINVGIRHLLPIYAPMALTAAGGALWLARHRSGQLLTTTLLSWQMASTAAVHPDYLPWFNAFAGRHPERIAVDSNFDWGQDVLRLARQCRRDHVPAIASALFSNADFDAVGLPPRVPIGPTQPLAVSETTLAVALARDRAATEGLLAGRTFTRVGKTIRLYAPR